jgi:alkylhydroperoxidase family enzyme
MATHISRFHIHDELSAPQGSLPILRGALGGGGQLPNIIGVLAGAPAALRAYARMRSELRSGRLRRATAERIALAVAAHFHADASLALHRRSARNAGLGLDDIALATEWDARDPREAVLLRYLRAALVDRDVPLRLHEEVLEAGWSEEEMLEALALVAQESLTALVDLAGDVPVDGSTEESRRLRAA